MNAERILVRYRVATPMFGGGAQPADAELRLASFKGMLRWWWRAIAWARLGRDLAEIQRAEARLFGSAGGGQSRVTLRLERSTAGPAVDPDRVANRELGLGAGYLGYGALSVPGGGKADDAARRRRHYLAPFEFALELRARSLAAGERQLLVDALRAVGLFGGLGAKSRKGFGSLVLTELAGTHVPPWPPPPSLDALTDELAPFLRDASAATELPPYTAFSARTRIVVVAASGRASETALLDDLGRELVRYRSWGKGGWVLRDIPREANFADDHDLMKRPASQRREHPRRIVFGLPHLNGRGPEQVVKPAPTADGRALDRRASPLWIHLHTCGAVPVAVLTLMPAVFLPDGARATIDVGGPRVPIAADAVLWKPIEDFLTRMLTSRAHDPRGRKQAFGTAREVRP